jgi:enoyl-[acyl-carrier protein] reductase II
MQELGLIGAGCIRKYYANTFRNVKKKLLNLWVNVPMYPNVEEIMKIIVEEGVKIVFYLGRNQNMDSVFKTVSR